MHLQLYQQADEGVQQLINHIFSHLIVHHSLFIIHCSLFIAPILTFAAINN